MTRKPIDPKIQVETKTMDSACRLAESRKKTGALEHPTDLGIEQKPKQPKDTRKHLGEGTNCNWKAGDSATPAADDHKVAVVRTEGPGEAEPHERLTLICQDSFLGLPR